MMSRLVATAAALLLASPALGVPGAKHSIGTIRPKSQTAPASAPTESLSEKYTLVGTISCDACASPFQPVAVVREHGSGRLLHLRVGDELVLPSGEHAMVAAIGSGDVEVKASSGTKKLRKGGFPDESTEDTRMIAKTPPSFVPPPDAGARW